MSERWTRSSPENFMDKKDVRRQPVEEAGVGVDEAAGVIAPGEQRQEQAPDNEMEDMFGELGEDLAADDGAEKKETVDEAELGRRRLEAGLKNKGLAPRFALELVADFDPQAIDDELVASVRSKTEEYGINFDDLPEEARQELLVMSLGAERSRSERSKEAMSEAVEGAIHRELFVRSVEQINKLESALNGDLGPEELKGSLRAVMESMNNLSKRISLEKEDDRELWGVLYRQFEAVANRKRAAGEPDVRKLFSEVFEEFSDFIEDDLVAYYVKGKTIGTEQAVNFIYGRSQEEVEEIKSRNREAVVAEIEAMREEPGVTVEMLEKLHALNNRGIVPKKASRLREGVNVSFGQRVGVLAEDVRPEMASLVERTNDLIDKDIVTDMSKLRYEIEVAKLHNDLLDMHPFQDRNGSTALLFLELMMARKGYKPPTERKKDYYDNLAKVLDYNPVAVAVVGYEQYRIANKPGFYEGKVMSDESRGRLQEIVDARKTQEAERAARIEAAKAARKKRPKAPPRAEA